MAALRAAIAGLLADEPLRRAMAARCRQVAVAEYSLELQARRYRDLYASLLDAAQSADAVEDLDHQHVASV